jgi:hypothetical protein
MRLAKIQALNRGLTEKSIGVKYECDKSNKIFLTSKYTKNQLTLIIESPSGVTETIIEEIIDKEEAEIILMWAVDYIESYGHACYEEWYNDPTTIDITEMLPSGYETLGNIEMTQSEYEKFCEEILNQLK